MHTSLPKHSDWPARAWSGLAAFALAMITLGTLVVVPALLESRHVAVHLPHVDEAAPRIG